MHAITRIGRNKGRAIRSGLRAGVSHASDLSRFLL
jgi:hypothetical protein